MAIDLNRVAKTIRKLRKLLKKDSELLVPKDVHDLRTRTQRFEASIKALQLERDITQERLLRCLGRMRKRAGKVRDIDVLTSDMLRIHADDHQDCAVRLIEHLGAERHRLAAKLRKSIRRYGKRARWDLKKVSRRMAGLRPDSDTGIPQATAGLAELALPPVLNRRNLHAYRIKVKKLRYVLQAAQNSDRQRFVHALGETKDAIGDWHDWEEMIAIAREVLDEGNRCPLVQKMKKISDEKYKIALAAATKMRREFVGRRSRTERARRKSAAPAIVKAVGAMAS
jgi:CHAD domain-containing protein